MRRRALIAALIAVLGAAVAVASASPRPRARQARVCGVIHKRCVAKLVTRKAHIPRSALARVPGIATIGVEPVPGEEPTTTTAPDATPVPDPPPLPRRLVVDENEYSVYPTRNPVGSGVVEFNVKNLGQDEHDLTIADGTGIVAQTGIIASGGTAIINATLAAGSYKLYCSLFDGAHDSAGMHATLTVKDG